MADAPVAADRRAVAVTMLVAAGLAGAWLAAPPLGPDLSAQVARADFFAAHGWAPVDFRWYGGVSPHGYSLLSPPLMAWLGPRLLGAVALLASSLLFVLLLLHTRAPRPLLGGVLGAAGFAGNLVSGRVTFALGITLALAALLPLAGLIMNVSARVLGRAGEVGGGSRRELHDRPAGRLIVAGALAALAAAASPVAGLFTGLVGAALLLSAVPRVPPRAVVAGGAALAVGAAVPMLAMAGLFGAGGWMNISRDDTLHAAGASLAVALLVPHRTVRAGALLSAAGVVAAYLLTTPVGLNATRLAVMFSVPVVAAYATVPGWLRRRTRIRVPAVVWLVPVLAALVWWQPPVVWRDLHSGDDPAASREFLAPLQQRLGAATRVEVVPTEHYWESAYVDAAPLARGWLRQADTGRNPLFFDGSLDADSYRRWLVDNAVSHVAIADTRLSWVGGREAELVRQGLPYLTLIWAGEHWRLYEVDGAEPLVAGPAVLREAAADRTVFEADAAGEVLVRVRWSRWLAIDGPGEACLAPAGEWAAVRVTEPGEYALTGSVTGAGPRC